MLPWVPTLGDARAGLHGSHMGVPAATHSVGLLLGFPSGTIRVCNVLGLHAFGHEQSSHMTSWNVLVPSTAKGGEDSEWVETMRSKPLMHKGQSSKRLSSVRMLYFTVGIGSFWTLLIG